MTITQDEQWRRAHIVSLARRELAAQGWQSSDANHTIQDAYIHGEADLDDLVTQALAEPAGLWSPADLPTN